MIRIGAINIDTSHPLGFGEALEKIGGAKYVGVYNDSFRGDDEVNGFIRRFKLEKRCSSLEELADMCDIGFIHSCNWDEHLTLAQPFFKKDKPVFIDKPMVGNEKDCRIIEELSKEGNLIIGSSSARYCYEIRDYLKIPIEERGETIQLFGTSGVDEFNYGIHIVEAAGAILGTGADWVKYMGTSNISGKTCDSYYVQYKNGKSFIYNTMSGIWQPFTLTIMTSTTTHQIEIDSSKLYQALLEEIIKKMMGQPSLIADTSAIIESSRIMLAGKSSKLQNGSMFKVADLTENSPTYDGRTFYEEYSKAASSMYAKL